MGNAALFTTRATTTPLRGPSPLASTTGNNNIAIGFAAGFNVTTGSNNIHIGNQGLAADTALIRIGTEGTPDGHLHRGDLRACRSPEGAG